MSPLKGPKDEVVTVDGKCIDHLAVDEQGHVYIFECKIARNHEMRSVCQQKNRRDGPRSWISLTDSWGRRQASITIASIDLRIRPFSGATWIFSSSWRVFWRGEAAP